MSSANVNLVTVEIVGSPSNWPAVSVMLSVIHIPLLDDIYQRKSSVTIDFYCMDRKWRYDVNYDYDPAALRIIGSSIKNVSLAKSCQT
jgi:hypothetical protein